MCVRISTDGHLGDGLEGGDGVTSISARMHQGSTGCRCTSTRVVDGDSSHVICGIQRLLSYPTLTFIHVQFSFHFFRIPLLSFVIELCPAHATGTGMGESALRDVGGFPLHRGQSSGYTTTTAMTATTARAGVMQKSAIAPLRLAPPLCARPFILAV